MNPRPPISIKRSMTICPKRENELQMSTRERPVTHVADVEVNSAVSFDILRLPLAEMGSDSNIVPNMIIKRNASAIV